MLVYKELKKRQVVVRGLVRNVTKAKELLDCGDCGEAEGIFVGDVTNQESLVEPMKGVDELMILSASVPICDMTKMPPQCHFPEGAAPKDVDWEGTKKQIEVFAAQNPRGEVFLCSSMGTTQPDSFLDKLGHGYTLFYKLNQEAFIMASGLPYTIVKPCGLSEAAPGGKTLVVGHDDALSTNTAVARADVARVMVEAVARGATGLRFDVCSTPEAPKQPTDFGALLEAARLPWHQDYNEADTTLV